LEIVSGQTTKTATLEHPPTTVEQQPEEHLLYYSIPLTPSSPSTPSSSSLTDSQSDVSSAISSETTHPRNEQNEVPLNAEVADPACPALEGAQKVYEIRDYDPAPTDLDFEHLQLYASEISGERSAVDPKDRYDLNWLSFTELYDCRDCLCEGTRRLLGSFARSKWDAPGWLETGLKTTNGTLPEAILLLIAAEVWDNIIPNGHTIIEANLRGKDGKYFYKAGKRRFISPRAASVRIRGFQNNYAPEQLFPNHHAYAVLFESSKDLRSVGHNPAQKRQDYETFFAKNVETLRLWKKERKIRAFFASHEITCLSIILQLFNPHSHAVIWVDAESDASFIDALVEEGKLIKYIRAPKRTWDELKHFIYYMMRAHSLAAVYKREFSHVYAKEFNKLTVQAFHALVELQTGDGGSKGKQKTHQEGIPRLRD